MGKLFLVLIVALGLGLSFPESRDVIVEHTRPLMNPASRWHTVQELSLMVEDLELHQETRGDLPRGRGEFDAWLDRRYPRESSRHDAWGTRYRLEIQGDSFRVVSAGPDETFSTDDDIWRGAQRRRGGIR